MIYVRCRYLILFGDIYILLNFFDQVINFNRFFEILVRGRFRGAIAIYMVLLTIRLYWGRGLIWIII
jgi:hypothetical protein